MAMPPRADSADLLQERRAELGLQPEPVAIQPARDLLLKGGALGLTLLLLSVGAWIWLMRQADTLEAEVERLQPVEMRLQSAQQRLKAMTTKTKALESETSRITSQLVSIRSGSAFLQQLRLVTPEGVQLKSVSALPQQLSISGIARGSDAIGSFARINALALNLESLPDIPDEGATVEQAKTDDAGSTEFSLTAAIDSSVRASPAELRSLGAEGLARRYERLRQDGFDL